MSMSSKKVYPKLSTDENGKKFHFDEGNTHFTIRFAGNPMLLLEYLFIKRWGSDFTNAYQYAKEGKSHEGHPLLRECRDDLSELLEVIDLIHSNGKNSLVVYINDLVWVRKN